MLKFGLDAMDLPKPDRVRQYQYFTLSVLFFAGFLFLAYSMRSYMHCSYLMLISDSSEIEQKLKAYWEYKKSKRRKQANKNVTKPSDSVVISTVSQKSESRPWDSLDPVRLKNLKIVHSLLWRGMVHYAIG